MPKSQIMKGKIFIEKNDPQSAVHRSLIDKILGLVNPNYIFISTPDTSDEFIYTVTILVEKQQLCTEFYKQLNEVFKDYPSIHNRVFSLPYVQILLKDCNLYFINNCVLGKLVYNTTVSERKICDEMLDIQNLLEGAISRFVIEKEKINTFRQEAGFYLQSGKYPQSAFVYRQALELMFRTAADFIMGKSLISHSIESQQRYIQDFAPSLTKAFDMNDKQDYQLLSLLDQCYLSVRYGNNFEITEKELEEISYKVLLIDTGIEELFQTKIRQARKKIKNKNQCVNKQETDNDLNTEVTEFNNTETMSENTIDPKIIIPETIQTAIIATSGIAPPNESLQQIIGYINMHINVEAIYSFGYRNWARTATSAFYPGAARDRIHQHHDLLLITEQTDQNIIANITDIIHAKTDGSVSVTLLFHKISWFEDVPEARKYFIDKIIQNAQLVYQNVNFKGIGVISITERDIRALRTYWENRKIIALIFLEAEAAMERPTGEQVQEAMLHQATEHICLGLINLFLGYRPHHFALGYLFSLCENFTSLTADLFPRYTVEDKKLFKRLAANLSQLRYKELERISFTDTEVLHKRCWSFYEQATLLAEQELEHLSSQ